MMRFRCPSCQHTLEVDRPTETALCPACQQWCRIPVFDEFAEARESVRRVVAEGRGEPRLAGVDQREEILDVVAVPEEASRSPHADEVEDVKFEIIEEGEERRRKPKRRRRRRRRSSGGGFDVDFWTSPSLILLVFMTPGALIVSVVFFLVHPGMGFACFLMTGGSIWFTVIAAEDGWPTALLVLFVPFYAFYYMLNNWERVAIPCLLQMVGTFIFFLSMALMKSRLDDRWSAAPPLRSANRMNYQPDA